jgi:SAM-dependent methyltransferase
MTGWPDGYVVDIGYTHGFYQELTPSLLGFVALMQGKSAPGLGAQPLTYCELGCGQGFSTNLLASVNPHIQFYAADFNPSHVVGARELAVSAGLDNVRFFDTSFAEFLEQPGLPQFDIVALHGVYSWISEENRRVIVRFLREKLKPGGLVYVSYNSMPGWASVMPLRNLLYRQASQDKNGRGAAGIDQALAFVERLQGVKARYFTNNPKVVTRLESLKKHHHSYIAHEYLTRDSNPFYFADIASELFEAKLSWIGSAAVLDNLDVVNFTPEQKKLLSEIDDIATRETIRDCIVDQQFRRDVFVKGAVSLGTHTVQQRWRELRFALTRGGRKVPREAQGAFLKITFTPEIYDPLIQALENGPRIFRELEEEPTLAKVGFSRISQALTYLVALGAAQPCLPEEGNAHRRARAAAFNRAVADYARDGKRFSFFAAGETGGGIAVDQIRQLIWLARQQTSKDAPAFVWAAMEEAGWRIVPNGKPLQTRDENLAELISIVADFDQELGPVLDKLGAC